MLGSKLNQTGIDPKRTSLIATRGSALHQRRSLPEMSCWRVSSTPNRPMASSTARSYQCVACAKWKPENGAGGGRERTSGGFRRFGTGRRDTTQEGS